MSLVGSTAAILPKRPVLTVGITSGGFWEQVNAIMALARERHSAYVCCVNAHMVVEATRPDFNAVVNNADFATPDGMPVLYALNRFHGLHQERVAGNDLMPALLARASEDAVGVYLYGGAEKTLARIKERAALESPELVISGAHSPPYIRFEQMDFETEAARINASGAGLILVSLGCPKQERFMAAMKGKVNAVMVGLGGAFLLYAGVDKRAPKWMRDLSLEWLFRLVLEPGRLWRRYLVTNSRFIGLYLRARISGKYDQTGLRSSN